VNESIFTPEYILRFVWLKNFASMAIILPPEYQIWSISGLYTVNNRYVDEELGNPFNLIE
jgi:hypothetical protein